MAANPWTALYGGSGALDTKPKKWGSTAASGSSIAPDWAAGLGTTDDENSGPLNEYWGSGPVSRGDKKDSGWKPWVQFGLGAIPGVGGALAQAGLSIWDKVKNRGGDTIWGSGLPKEETAADQLPQIGAQGGYGSGGYWGSGDPSTASGYGGGMGSGYDDDTPQGVGRAVSSGGTGSSTSPDGSALLSSQFGTTGSPGWGSGAANESTRSLIDALLRQLQLGQVSTGPAEGLWGSGGANATTAQTIAALKAALGVG